MFGISEKEYDRQEHAQRLESTKAKSEAFKSILSNCSDDLVFVGEHVLRKSFIHKVSKSKNHDGTLGTRISYFNFNLKAWSDYMTDDIFIPETEIPFSEIINILK